MDPITQIRQMMAEAKFLEAQIAAELQLSVQSDSVRQDILPLYLESLLFQQKKLPSSLVVEVAEKFFEKDSLTALQWLIHLSEQDKAQHFLRYQKLMIKHAESRGAMKELYELVSQLQIFLVERQIPQIPEFVSDVVMKYFRNDFHLNLQRLAILLMQGDESQCERLVQDLFMRVVEASLLRGASEKFAALYQILNEEQIKGKLEVYKFLSLFLARGFSKSEYKRLIEMVIYFDDQRFKALILKLLHEHSLDAIAKMYAQAMKNDKDFSFVYFDKFHQNLKTYFIVKEEKAEEVQESSAEVPDLKLTSKSTQMVSPLPEVIEQENIEDEALLIHALNLQDHDPKELIEISTSFLESQLPKAALRAAQLAREKVSEENEYLKSCYLILTCFLQLGDYRAAVDVSLEALGRARTKDDVLSFMYGQAEAHLRLQQKKKAKKILEQIMGIDANYRLTKDRLEKLHEI